MSIGINGINNFMNQTGSLTGSENKATKSGSYAYAEQKKFEYLLESMSGREFAYAYRNGKIDRNTFDTFVAWSVEQTSHKIKSFDEVRSILESFFVMEFDPAPFSGRTFNALTGSNTLTIRNGSLVELGNGYSIVFNGLHTQFRHNGRHLFHKDMISSSHVNQMDDVRGVAGFLNSLRHYADGNTPSPHFPNNDTSNTQRFLQMLGINTSQEFTVNGVRFRFVNDNIGGGGYVRRV